MRIIATIMDGFLILVGAAIVRAHRFNAPLRVGAIILFVLICGTAYVHWFCPSNEFK